MLFMHFREKEDQTFLWQAFKTSRELQCAVLCGYLHGFSGINTF